MPIEVHDLRLTTPGPTGQPWELAATVYLPPPLFLSSGPNVLVLLPGAGYGRGYFNLPVPGTSQAMYHAGRGNIVVAIDPLGVGDSSADEGAGAQEAVATLNSAVTQVVEGLKAGTLVPGLGPVAFGIAVGAGQSLGGHLLVATQAEYGTFEGIALLGSSMAGTQFPLPGGGSTSSPAEADFAYAFHWGEIPQVDPTVEPANLAGLVGADVAIGLPVRHGDAPWASRTIPSYVTELIAASASKAGEITSQVLVAAGERDVTRPAAEEAAVFARSGGVDSFVLPESAHMHNFAETREELWKRVDVFVHHSSSYDRRVQSTEYVAAMIAAASATAASSAAAAAPGAE
jgi:pimeloyl-ACP methyl ester carboxylesterase